MKLNALLDESRFITGPERLDAPLFIPPLEFGKVEPIELTGWRKTADGSLAAVDLSQYQITLLVGKPNQRAALGFWYLSTTLGDSAFIPVRATKEEVATALLSAFGACTVEGGNGSYVVTLTDAGVWILPTATFEGNTLSNVLVFEITPGTVNTPAQYRIEVLEVAPARMVPDDWAPGNTTPSNSFTQVNGKLWQLILSPLVDNGFFTLIVDGTETGFVNYTGGAYNMAAALAAAGKDAEVIPDGTGGFWVLFENQPDVAEVGGNLVILPWSAGNLDLTSTGVRELLDGLQFTSVKLAVVLVKDGQTISAASADVMLTMPVNQPATITIDAPQMAGLTFGISDDGAYMHVYMNGVRIADIVLNESTSDGDTPLVPTFSVSPNGAYAYVYVNGSKLYGIALSAPAGTDDQGQTINFTINTTTGVLNVYIDGTYTYDIPLNHLT